MVEKKFYCLIGSMVCLLLFSVNLHAQCAGSRVLFNGNWKFHKGEVQNAQLPSYNDAGWREVSLPHDWSIEGPYSRQWASATAYLPGGIGWYRKAFSIPASEKGKEIYIYFNGVYKDSKVWVNGHFLGRRPNGFVSFYYDMTPYLRFGSDNVVAVRVDHSQFADSRWYTGSGIYRNVYLITTNKMHIGLWGVSTAFSDVTHEHARLHTSVALVNGTGKAKNLMLENILVDKNGKVVAISSDDAAIPAGKEDTISDRLSVSNPQLWSTEKPVLYTLRTVVRSAGRIIDEKNTRVGIRSIRFDANQGFFLNGVHMKLKGVCLHDDAGCLGVAVPADVWRRRLKILKAAGCNAIRMSHNPHDPELYDLCDKMGFLVMDEAFDEWELGKHKWIDGWNAGVPGTDGYHEYFKKWADRDLRDMILRDRNHPCVILWSIGNEIDYPNDPYSDPILNEGRNPQIYGSGYMADHPAATNLTRIARQLVDVVKDYDTTRPVTAALAAASVSNKVGYTRLLDVAGYNYQEYRYQEDHKEYPHRKIFGSENGMSYAAWKAVKDNDFIAGQFLWTGIDYLGEAGKWPSRGSNAGLLDLAGFKKPAYFFRQSIWTTKPMIYIGASSWRRNGRNAYAGALRNAHPVWNFDLGDTILVSCFTNCGKAELFLNGKSLGEKQMNNVTGVISWLVPYQPGILSVKGYDHRVEKAQYRIATYSTPVGLSVSADTNRLRSDGQSVAHLVISVVDKNGDLVYDADNQITCRVTGAGKLLGLESGDNRSHESYMLDHRKAFHGKLLAYIQSGRKTGAIKVMISAPGLGRQEINIVSGK